ncbi:MAG: hypothetical protein ACYDBM_08855 [Candidatus Tyrphobacter sp.]
MENARRAPNLEEDGLRHVLCAGRVAEHFRCKAVDEPVIPIVQRLEGVSVTSADAFHEPICVLHPRMLRENPAP